MRAYSVLVLFGVASVSCFLTGCKTRAEKEAEISDFIPATFVSRLQVDQGRHATLFSPASRAVWMHDEVIAAKEEEAGTGTDAQAATGEQDENARTSLGNFLIIECTLESSFADSSIAYDVVGMKGCQAFLVTQEGHKLTPLQTIIGKCEEEPLNALRLFRRTNLFVFERRDLSTGMPVYNRLAPSAKLVITGYESDFVFEWPGVPFEQEKNWQLTCRDSARAVAKTSKTGISKLYDVGRTVAHHTN